MTNDKLLSALGLCRRAGKLAVGREACEKAVEKGACLMIVASDASARTRTAAERLCEGMCELLEIDRTQAEIGAAVGKRFALAATRDENFARLIRNNTSNVKEDDAI